MAEIALKFLTEDAVECELGRLYWAREDDGSWSHRVKDLSERFGVSVSKLPERVGIAVCATSGECRCTDCGATHILHSRNHLLTMLKVPGMRCADCADLYAKRREDERKQAEYRDRLCVLRAFPELDADPNWSPRNLSLPHRVALLALLRGGTRTGEDGLPYLAAAECMDPPFAPTQELSLSLLSGLYHSGGAAPAPHLHAPNAIGEAFVCEPDGSATYYVLRARWQIPVGRSHDRYASVLANVESLVAHEDHFGRDALELWITIATHECIQYLRARLNEHDLDLLCNERLCQAVQHCLAFYSTSQVMNLEWSVVRDLVAYRTRKRIHPKHASNLVPVRLESYADRAAANGWDVRPYRRDWYCPQSLVSQLLYNLVLKYGDTGFDLLPGAHQP